MWWEAFPANYMQIGGINLSCGDQMYAYVDYNYDYANEAHLYIQDEHNGYYIVKTYYNNWRPDLESAEWIDERSGCSLSGSNHYLLGDFKYVQWSGAEAVPNYNGAGWGPFQPLRIVKSRCMKPGHPTRTLQILVHLPRVAIISRITGWGMAMTIRAD